MAKPVEDIFWHPDPPVEVELDPYTPNIPYPDWDDEPDPDPEPPHIPQYQETPWEKDLRATSSILDKTIPMVYGSRKVTGMIGSWYYNSATKYLYLGIVFAYGEQASITGITVNGETTVPGVSIATAHVGDGSTALSTYLTTNTTGWTAADTTLWQGLAHVALRVDCRSANVPSSFTIEADLGGVLLDTTWRTGGSASIASTNPVDAAYHMMTGSMWRNLAAARISTASWEKVADWCEESMSDSSDRYSFNAIVRERNCDTALNYTLSHILGTIYVNTEGKICLWAEMPPAAITGEWSTSSNPLTPTAIEEDSTAGAATTEVAAGDYIYVGTNLRRIASITDDDTIVLDSAVTVSGVKVRPLTQVYVKKHHWLRPPRTADINELEVADQLKVRFDDANNRGYHEVEVTYGAGGDKTDEYTLSGFTDAGSATRNATSKIKIGHLQPFLWSGVVLPEVGAALEPGDVILMEDDRVSLQPVRVLPTIQIRANGTVGVALREYDPSAYSDDTAVTDTIPSLGGGFDSDGVPVFTQIHTVIGTTLYSVTNTSAANRVEVGSASLDTDLTATKIRLPNNVAILALTTSGSEREAIKMDSSNRLTIGNATDPIYLNASTGGGILIPDDVGIYPGWSRTSNRLMMVYTSASTTLTIGSYATGSPITAIYGRPIKLYSISDIELSTYTNFKGITSQAGLPSTTYFNTSCWGVYKNTSTGAVFFCYNDGGTLKKVQLT